MERVEAEAALERFVTWQQTRSDRELLGTEVEFSCDVDLESERVRLTGTADRVERESDGRIRIIDFKTGRATSNQRDRPHDQRRLARDEGFADVAEAARPAALSWSTCAYRTGQRRLIRVFSPRHRWTTCPSRVRNND